MTDPVVDIRRAKDGAVMVFVDADAEVYVYRVKRKKAPAKHLMRGKLEVYVGGKQ